MSCSCVWGGTPLSAGSIMDSMGSIRIGSLLYPSYNLVVIGVGIMAAIGLWWLSTARASASSCAPHRKTGAWPPRSGSMSERVYVQAFAIGCFMAGLGGAVVVPAQAAVLGMGVDALILAFVVIVIGGLGSLEGALVGALIVGFVRTAGIQFFAEIELAVLYLIAAAVLLVRRLACSGRLETPMPAARTDPSQLMLVAVAVPAIAALAMLPRIVDLYQTELLIYGLTFAIAALGFNLLLGYTGLLSFGHSAYFGMGAYTVAFIVRDLHVQSMELCILGGLPTHARHRRCSATCACGTPAFSSAS